MRLTLAAATTMAVLAGSGAAAARAPLHTAGLHSPTDKIRCFQFKGFLRCDQSGATNAAPKPKHPCDAGDYGFSFAVRATGHARRVCVSDAVPGGPRLHYGQVWSRQGVACRVSSAGLRCHNRSGHGFFTSTSRQYLF